MADKILYGCPGRWESQNIHKNVENPGGPKNNHKNGENPEEPQKILYGRPGGRDSQNIHRNVENPVDQTAKYNSGRVNTDEFKYNHRKVKGVESIKTDKKIKPRSLLNYVGQFFKKKHSIRTIYT